MERVEQKVVWGESQPRSYSICITLNKLNPLPNNEQKECKPKYSTVPSAWFRDPNKSGSQTDDTDARIVGSSLGFHAQRLSMVPVDPIWELVRKEVALGAN